MWPVINKKLNTKILLNHKGMSLDTKCVFCCYRDEDIKHLYFQCPFTYLLWINCLKYLQINNVLHFYDQYWYWEEDRRFISDSVDRCLVDLLNLSLSWVIWIETNNRCFKQISKPFEILIRNTISNIAFWIGSICLYGQEWRLIFPELKRRVKESQDTIGKRVAKRRRGNEDDI